MKLQTLITVALVAVLAWQLLTFWRPELKKRMSRAIRVATIGYIVLIVWRLVTSPLDPDQLQTAGFWLLLFGVVWVVAWLVTRFVRSSR